MAVQPKIRSQAATSVRPTDVRAVLLGGAAQSDQENQHLSKAEERFERIRRTSGLFLAPLVTLTMWLLPLGIEPEQQRLAAVLTGVIVLWFCESVPIPVGGLIGVAGLVLAGVAPADEVLAPFGSTTIFTFIGAFILAQSMLKHGVAQRVAFLVLSIPGVGTSVVRIIIAFGLVTCLLSIFVSNTATVAMLLPTALGILVTVSRLLQKRGIVAADFDPTRLKISSALLLMLAYGAGVGGLISPVATPPNLIGRGMIEEMTGERISFVQWVGAAAPIALTMFVVLAIVLLLINKPETRKIEGVAEYLAEERARQGPMSRAEWNTIVAFSITVFLWVLPAIVGSVAGMESAAFEFIDQRLNEGIVAVVGAALLFVLPQNWKTRKMTVTWADATRIDWGTILLFGSGLIFGAMLTQTGLAEVIGTSLFETTGVSSTFMIVLLSAALALFISETTSNTATAAVVVPIIVPLAVAADVNPVLPALVATFAASFSFMLPIATPQNAIVYGSGCVPITRMVKSGVILNLLGFLALVLILPFSAGLMGIGI